MADETAPAEWPSIFPLTKSIQAYGGTVKELKLDDLSAEHVLEFGLLDQGFTGDKVPAFLERIANVPEKAIKEMAGVDLIRLTTKLSRFFTEAAR